MLITSRQQHAFTLIEVLVALVIIAVTVSALWIGLLHAANAIESVADNSSAYWVAQNVLVKARLGLIPMQSSGQSQQAGRLWYWQLNQVPSKPKLVRMHVCVKRNIDNSNCAAQLTELRL